MILEGTPHNTLCHHQVQKSDLFMVTSKNERNNLFSQRGLVDAFADRSQRTEDDTSALTGRNNPC